MADHPARKVLITGAAGGIGRHLAETLVDYDLVLHAHTKRADDPAGVHYADLDRYDEAKALMDGVDTVVHMAGASAPDSSWEAVLTGNIVSTRNVLEAARECGVRRVVYASSNHAMGMYDRDEQWPVYPTHLPRPDSLYGVSKVFGETIGRFYHDKYGLDFIALRIGWMDDDSTDADVDLLRAMWLSPDDAEQVVRCAIESDTTFGLYYAVSDNPNRRWDITNAMVELGYRPRDAFFDDDPTPERPDEPTPSNWPEDA